MEISEAVEFVRRNHRGVLAVTRADGKPQMSPVTGSVNRDGLIVVSSRETAYKVRSVRARPYAAYCGFADQFFGPAQVISLPDAMEQLVDYYRSVSGEHPDWDDYRAAMERDQRVLIAITPERVGPSVQG